MEIETIKKNHKWRQVWRHKTYERKQELETQASQTEYRTWKRDSLAQKIKQKKLMHK